MKFNYNVRQLNSSFSDPVFFIRNVYMKKAVLFDLGKLGKIGNHELHDISCVFVSHTHMDHFSGFDRLLRSILITDMKIRIFGPKNIIKNVEGKLNSYTWNLVDGYGLEIEVIELNYTDSKKAVFKANNEFNREDLKYSDTDLDLDDGFKIKYEIFDHGIPSIGYRLIEPRIINIQKDKLLELGFKEGIWLKEFKNKILNNEDGSITVNTVDGEKVFNIKELAKDICIDKQQQDITYITDIAPHEENILKAIKLADKSYLLIIESVFMDIDFCHASEKNHLTITIAKDIFYKSQSEFIRFIHFAPRYEKEKEMFFEELYHEVKNKILIID